jgi:hypothetical protein
MLDLVVPYSFRSWHQASSDVGSSEAGEPGSICAARHTKQGETASRDPTQKSKRRKQGKNKYMGSQRDRKPSGSLKMYAPGALHRTYKQRENLLCYYPSRNVSFFITFIDIYSILVVKLTFMSSFDSNYTWADYMVRLTSLILLIFK